MIKVRPKRCAGPKIKVPMFVYVHRKGGDDERRVSYFNKKNALARARAVGVYLQYSRLVTWTQDGCGKCRQCLRRKAARVKTFNQKVADMFADVLPRHRERTMRTVVAMCRPMPNGDIVTPVFNWKEEDDAPDDSCRGYSAGRPVLP